jgi:hypothetical protein
VAAGAAAAEVAAVAAAAEVAAVAGSLAAEVAAAAGAVVASGSVPAWLAWLARAAADPGERAACAKSPEKRRCDCRRITSSLPQRSDKLGVGRRFAKVPRGDIAVLV